jgi:hypothetical protein
MDSNQPREMEAVHTTIVGGRPPGSGKALGAIPRGIEVLIKKAAVDAAFRAVLLAKRSAAAHEIGLKLTPAEAMMLDAVPAAQLAAIIAGTRVEPWALPAFLGKAAAAMLLALGVVVAGCDRDAPTKGDRPDEPPPPARQKEAKKVAEQIIKRIQETYKVEPPLPASDPWISQPASTPASLPFTKPITEGLEPDMPPAPADNRAEPPTNR